MDAVWGTVCRALALSWSFPGQHPIVSGISQMSEGVAALLIF
ncbi:MAG TPA: hypothetical protein VED37_03310 [Ktedonobacteraceae bacterium]|nr:hypothetical protein [Ktedonobacteraceae bacterium]